MLQIKNRLGGTGGNSEGLYVWKKYESIPDPYLCFLGNEEFTLQTYNNTKNWDGTLEYSTDVITWSTWDGVTVISSSGKKLYLRGTGNTVITGNLADYSFLFNSINQTYTLRISCQGNIESLLDYETVAAGNHPPMGSYCFAYLFDYSVVVNSPELPATILAESCYTCMFRDCYHLTTAPELPATTLAKSCYASMFRSCSKLTTAPELPATILAEGCYDSMFHSCSNLTIVPELPATALAEGCYSSMFHSCVEINLSSTQTGEYQTPYRIPISGTGTVGTNSLTDMFTNTGGTFKGTPEINTTYYYYHKDSTVN